MDEADLELFLALAEDARRDAADIVRRALKARDANNVAPRYADALLAHVISQVSGALSHTELALNEARSPTPIGGVSKPRPGHLAGNLDHARAAVLHMIEEILVTPERYYKDAPGTENIVYEILKATGDFLASLDNARDIVWPVEPDEADQKEARGHGSAPSGLVKLN